MSEIQNKIQQNEPKKSFQNSNLKFNPVIIIAKPIQQQPLYSCLPAPKSKKSVRQKNSLKQWSKEELFAYAIFIAKLKESLQYTNSFHSLRLYNWMLDYMKNANSCSIHTSKLTIQELKNYHISNISKQSSSDRIISRIKQTLLIDEWSFETQLQKFDSQFPQTQAVLDYYSLDTTTSNYHTNCKIASNFLNQFINHQLQSRKKPKAQEWTRYQYLTYLTFFIIKEEESSQKIKKEEFYDLAEYSFDQNFGLLWAQHLKIFHRTKNVIGYLVKQWKFTNEVIQNQKAKLGEFLKEKNQRKQQNMLHPSLFELFLKERKMTKLNNQLKIITDKFELISDSLEYFDFYQKHSNEFRSRRKFQKTKKHSIYLRARFEVNQSQKTQLNLLKEKLMLLRQIFADEKESSYQDKNRRNSFNDNEEKNDRMELEQGSAKSCSFSNLEQRYKDEFDDQNDFIKGRKMTKINQMELNFEQNAQNPPQIWPIQLQQQYSVCEQKPKYYQQLNPGQSFLGYYKQLDSLEKFNSSIQSTEASFGFANYSKNPDECNKIKEQLSSQVNRLPQISQEESNMRSSEKENQDNNSEREFQKYQKPQNSQQQNFQALTIKEFIQTLVTQEQYTIFQPIFERKILEHRLMVKVTQEKQQIYPKRDKTDIYWHFSENVKFVSFLITTKFAFTNCGFQYHHTFGVMSEFVRTKNPDQCCDHYQKIVFYVTGKICIDYIIEKLIDKYQIPKINLYKEVNRQKQHYLQTKGKSIFQLRNRQHFQKFQTDKLKENINLIVDNLEQKCFEFNIMEEYLVSKPQFYPEQQEISQIEKERYLDCLESFNKNNINSSRKRLMQFADEIFKDRAAEQRQQLLERYHRMMMKKHKKVQVILLREKTRKENKRYTKKKNSRQTEKSNNIRFAKYFCQQIESQKDAAYLEIEILKDMFEQIQIPTQKVDQVQNKLNFEEQ